MEKGRVYGFPLRMYFNLLNDESLKHILFI